MDKLREIVNQAAEFERRRGVRVTDDQIEEAVAVYYPGILLTDLYDGWAHALRDRTDWT